MVLSKNNNVFIKKNNHIEVGIEAIGFYTSNAVLKLSELAKNNHYSEEKYSIGIEQDSMSVITLSEDIITMAYCASIECLKKADKQKIDMILFATESCIDNSNSSACELHSLLKLKNNCRCLEIKHACYGGTGALMLAKNYIANNSCKKALVVMSDVAFYGLKTKGEPTQGCGAIAILISSEPKIALFNNDNVYQVFNEKDFYRPTYSITPLYDGHLSIKNYINMFKNTLAKYNENGNYFDFLISHMPFSKMLDKCCKVAKIDVNLNKNSITKMYSKTIGNTYTASLYIGFLSLLENNKDDLTGKKIGLFSYGSGSECELFSVTILQNYKNYLNQSKHEMLLKDRKIIDYNVYCKLLNNFEFREKQVNWLLNDKSNINIKSGNQLIKLCQIKNGIRFYKKIFCN